jgi:hypothetical protein
MGQGFLRNWQVLAFVLFGDVRIASLGSGRDLVEGTWTPYVGNSDQRHNLCPIFSYTNLEHPHQYLVYVTLQKNISHIQV